MLLDSAALAGQNNIRAERPEAYARPEVGSRPGGEVRPEAGQASAASPAVVMNLSAAALESSRALTQTSQAADQDKARESVRESEQRQEQAMDREAPAGRVDLRV
jgi:hypothetical protein